jgi:signal transduction histidine kinase/CheY-like chemotaxis protein
MPDDVAASERILLLTTGDRDARIARGHLARVGISSHVCESVEELCEAIAAGAGAALLAEEQLDEPAMRRLQAVLARQPAWSDFPMLVVANRKRTEHQAVEPLDALGNVTLLDPPLRIRTLLRSVHAALRGRRRQYAARAAIVERDRFLAILGHELRNPLSAISLATEVVTLESGSPSPHLKVMRRQVAHLSRLVDDLLDVARVTSGRIQLQREPTRFDVLVRDHVMVSMRAGFSEAGVALTGDFREPVWVQADRVRIEQVVNNLLANALKFTPCGGHVHLEQRRESESVRLSVIDDGAGIAPEVLPHVFEQFVQGESTLHRAEGGMGLGLALVRMLVELHGGSVTAHSEGKGKGSVFTIRLPAFEPDHRQRGDAVPGAVDAEAEDGASESQRILVVEDNDDARELLAIALRRVGHRVVEAEDGEAALDAMEGREIDAAIIDLGLPKLDGYEVARRARREYGRDLFLVALSGYGQPEDVQRAKDAGYDVHLTKPADIPVICAVLDTRSSP